MTQQRAQREDFGPTWPEVTGFGAGPNKQHCVTVATVTLLADIVTGEKHYQQPYKF